MTDKQIPNERRQYEYKSVYPEKSIIIDGVDVSGCEFYGETMKTHNCTLYCESLQSCKGTDCAYKNWKRKEQECEELKAELELFKTSNQTTIDQLKAENEELKGIRDRNFLSALEERKRADKLSKTLTEIKEIAKNGCYDDCGMPLDELSIILQKISEVTNE